MKQIFTVATVILLFACNQSKRAAPVVTPPAVSQDSLAADTSNPEFSQPDRFKSLIDQGVGFLASGNEPFWALEISFGSKMVFKTPDGADIITPVNMVAGSDTSLRRFSGNAAGGSLAVEIRKMECINDMSGEKVDYQVKLDVRRTGQAALGFTGCGRYLGTAKTGRLPR